MCGIAGFLTSQPESDDQLRHIATQMSDAIRHRGPDGDGVWTDAMHGIAVSHRRLSIVDLSPTGAQPMVSHCGNLVMVYNGEVYNTAELKEELSSYGIDFKGTSDTEVILEGYARWGIRKTTEKLIGMFAMAVWNRKERSITLIRDRLGIKPLYWTCDSKRFIFGSELKALTAHPQCPTDLNRSVIAGYLRKSYINNPQTIYSNVNHLQPGWMLTWKVEMEKPALEQYWSLSDVVAEGQTDQFKGDDIEATEHLRNLLSDAVKRRMVADVPLGAFLSGGIDSSAVVALMQQNSTTAVKTFSIGFNESQYDESPYAAEVAKHLGTDHTELFVTAEDALEVIPQLPTIYDEPFSDPSQIPTYLVSKLTREHVTVALSGDGGDELFAGYNRYFDAQKLRLLNKQPRLLRKVEATVLESLAKRLQKKPNSLLPASVANYMASGRAQSIARVLIDGTMSATYKRHISRVENPCESLVYGDEPASETWTEASKLDFGKDDFSFMQYIDTLDYLPDDILTKVDRASMATSLEARVPILDHRVVEFSWRLPQEMKVRERKGKWILRNLLEESVPAQLIDRPKMGFGVPIGIWIKGPLKEWAEELLSENSLKNTNIFNPEIVRRKWSEHIKGERNWEYHLWDVLSMQAWANQYH